MTPDEIETAAIEAALRKFSVGVLVAMGERPEVANARFEKELHTSDPEAAAQLAELRGITVEAISAYEREMWRPVEEAPHGEPVILWSPGKDMELRPYSTGRSNQSGSSMSYHAWATHFRPLPRREGE